MQSRQQSPKRSQDSKRGIFTSKDSKQKDLKPSVIPYLDNSLQGLRQNLQNLKAKGRYTQNQNNPNLVTSTALYSHINHINNQSSSFQSQNNLNNLSPIPNRNVTIEQQRRSLTPTKVTFNHHENRNFVPGGIQYVPIQSGVQNFQHVQQIHRNQEFHGLNGINVTHGGGVHDIHRLDGQVHLQGGIQTRKTFVPIHVYNEVPARIVVNAETKSHETRNVQNNNDQAYDVLLNEYEKVFQRLQAQQQTTQQFEQLIASLRVQLNSQNKARRYSLNIVQLHDKLYSLYKKNVEEIVEKRKQRAKARIEQLLKSVSREVSYSTEEVKWVREI